MLYKSKLECASSCKTIVFYYILVVCIVDILSLLERLFKLQHQANNFQTKANTSH